MCRVKIQGAEEEMKENFEVRLRGLQLDHTPLLMHAAGLLPASCDDLQITAKEPIFENRI